MQSKFKVGAVIPCYKVDESVVALVAHCLKVVDRVYIIDDACPFETGKLVRNNITNENLIVKIKEKNGGVGSATKTGYQMALDDGMDYIVKLDGDGQMNPDLIPALIKPLKENTANYSKGNRFHFYESLKSMPKLRIAGNSILTLLARFSTGYWSLSDPTNGFTAIERNTLLSLNQNKLSDRFFFESDVLFRLNLNRSVVFQLPMTATYNNEKSNLNELRIIPEFLFKHFVNFWKRVFYDYFLRGLSIGSIELLLGILLFSFGLIYGIYNWIINYNYAQTPTGTIILASFTLLAGIQFLTSFFTFDVMREPKKMNEAISKENSHMGLNE